MNRNHLALFAAVAEAGSISGGARRMRISQPAVSKQVAELEHSLGVQLLERLPRGSRLTQAGVMLAEYARRWLAVEGDAVRAVEELRGLRRGRLAVGASLTIGGYLLPAVFAEFHRRYPEIELSLEIANTEQIERKLSEGAIELGLTEGPIQSEALDSEIFFHDELVVIAPPGHPLLHKKRLKIRDVCREPLIMREAGSGTRAVVEQALLEQGITVQPLLSLASPEAIKSVVAAGMGLAFVSRLTVALELRTASLGIVPVSDLNLKRPLRRQSLRGHRSSPALERFLEVLAKQVAR